jgi:predicted glycosyltransferase
VKVWIDLSNSPHPLLFEPIASRLEEAGAEVAVTVRDHAQTGELARERWPEARVIGGPSPAGRAAKARALADRALALARWARAGRPDVALSHNSYAQIVAARIAGVPAVTAMDFEHQPANHVAFRLARRILLPQALPAAAVTRQGARVAKVIRYPGLKEELTLASFTPDPAVVEQLGIERGNGTVLVVARTPPTGASYHRFENPLFWQSLRVLDRQRKVRCVVLARGTAEAERIERMGLANAVVPRRAIDSRSLLCEADLFIGAGGTMTREAALLGLPTLSAFAGRRPAVDAWLARQGALETLDSPAQVADVVPRPERSPDLGRLRAGARAIEEVFVDATIGLAGRRRARAASNR